MSISHNEAWSEVRKAFAGSNFAAAFGLLEAGASTADDRARLGLSRLETALYGYKKLDKFGQRRELNRTRSGLDRLAALRSYTSLKTALCFGNFMDLLRGIEAMSKVGTAAARANFCILRIGAAVNYWLSSNADSVRAAGHLRGQICGSPVLTPARSDVAPATAIQPQSAAAVGNPVVRRRFRDKSPADLLRNAEEIEAHYKAKTEAFSKEIRGSVSRPSSPPPAKRGIVVNQPMRRK